jgi:hypothetical protein
VLVTFYQRNDRDTVARAATNLSEWINNGKPTAGLKLEIPQHLMPTFQLLHSHGFHLRKVLGLGLKRIIKYDDLKRSLVMEVKFPNEDGWERITPKIALELRDSQDMRTADRIKERLTAVKGSVRPRSSGQSIEGRRPRLHAEEL